MQPLKLNLTGWEVKFQNWPDKIKLEQVGLISLFGIYFINQIKFVNFI